jgi:hypothetical protein
VKKIFMLLLDKNMARIWWLVILHSRGSPGFSMLGERSGMPATRLHIIPYIREVGWRVGGRSSFIHQK